MKSKQRLAQVVALALVLGFSGNYGAMADDILMKGGSETIEDKTVHGAWLQDQSMLTAKNVTFVDDTTNPGGKGEVAVDGGSTLNMTGGAIKVWDDYFTVEEGSTANITDAEVTSGAYANNASITMTNSKISGRTLYAGDKWENDAPLPLGKADGQPGKLQVNGGTVNVALIWGQASGGISFNNVAEVTVEGTEGLKLPDGKVLTGIYATEHGMVKFDGTEVAADTVKADAGTVSLKDSTGTFKNVELTQGASLTADSGAVVTADTLNVQGGARAIAENGGTLKAKSVQISGNKSTFVLQGKSNAAVSSLAINQGGTASITGGAEAEVANLTIQNASLDLGNGRNTLTVAKSLVSNKGLVRTANGGNKVVLAADTDKADAGTVSLKDNTGTFENVELTQGASLTADSGAFVTANTLNVQGGARAIAENGGTLAIADAMNITNGGSASVADGGTLNAKSVQVSGNKSTFSITGGAKAEVENLTIQNASLDLGNGTNKLTVAKSLVSNKGLVRTANGDNKVVLADGAKKTGDVTVQGEGKDYNSDALAGDSNKVKTLAEVVTTADGKTAASTVSGSEGVINGASVYKVENTADGIKITESYIPENETNRDITDLAALSLITWRQENNDLNKRLGEIRDSKGDDGVWARMARGEATFKGVKNQYNYYQMGYDKKLNDNWILGGAFSYTDGDNTFHRGTGQTKNSSFAVYGSNLRDDGSFIDLIAKYAHLKNEYDTPLGIGNGDYSTNGFSFSGEYGKRFHMDKFWLEPQVELTWGHVDSVNYSTENGARVHQNGMDSFVGRLGFSLGKDFSHGNVYARASYLYDFDGDVKASMTNGTVSREYREDIGGGWFEFGIGTNLNLGSDTHFYFDLEKAEGGSDNVKTPWQWNVGVRYSF